MRISDWSSDVCSSDLSAPRASLGKVTVPWSGVNSTARLCCQCLQSCCRYLLACAVGTRAVADMVMPCSSDSTLQSFDLLGGFVDQRDDPMQGRFVDIVAAEAVHQHLAQIAHRAADRGGIGAQMGRAPCRERGCRYV